MPDQIPGFDLLLPDVQEFLRGQFWLAHNVPRERLRFHEGMDLRDIDLYLGHQMNVARHGAPAVGPGAPLCIMLIGAIETGSGDEVAGALLTEFSEVHVFIHSPGGSIAEARRMYDALRACAKPVYTYALGDVESAAMWPFLAGDARYIDGNSTFLFHPPRGVSYGPMSQSRLEALESARSLRQDIGRLAETCAQVAGIPRANVRAWQAKETRFTAEEALRRNLATSRISCVSHKIPRSHSRLLWVGVGRGDMNFAQFKSRFVSRGVHPPTWRTVFSLAWATGIAKWVRFVEDREVEGTGRLGAAFSLLWRRKIWIGLMAALGTAASCAISHEPAPTSYTCILDPGRCSAAWELHQAFSRGDTEAVGPVALRSAAIAGPFFAERLHLRSTAGADSFDEYQVEITLMDGSKLGAFEAVVVSPSHGKPEIRVAAWRTEDHSRDFLRAVSLSFERIGDDMPVNPGSRDLRRSFESSEVVRQNPVLLLAPPPPAR